MRYDRDEVKALRSPILKRCEGLLFDNWWVLAFALFCLIAYEQGVYKARDTEQKLSTKMEWLQEEQTRQLARQQDIKLQINSQSDPEWIELSLMRVLGVVPKEQKKIYFRRHVTN